MKCYIIQKDPPEPFDFTIMKVQDAQMAEFEHDYKDRILAKGNDVQEVIIAFSKKENQREPIDLSLNQEQEQQANSFRRDRR